MLTGERAPPLHQNGDPLRHSLPPELRRVPAAMPKKTLPRRPRHYFAVAKVHLTTEEEGGRQRARGSAARPSLLRQKTRPRHPPPRLEQKCSSQQRRERHRRHTRTRSRQTEAAPAAALAEAPSPLLTGTLAAGAPRDPPGPPRTPAAQPSPLPFLSASRAPRDTTTTQPSTRLRF